MLRLCRRQRAFERLAGCVGCPALHFGTVRSGKREGKPGGWCCLLPLGGAGTVRKGMQENEGCSHTEQRHTGCNTAVNGLAQQNGRGRGSRSSCRGRLVARNTNAKKLVKESIAILVTHQANMLVSVWWSQPPRTGPCVPWALDWIPI